MVSKMIIENFEALKSWLSKTLEPICDADPSALAKYVLALVKKDKSEKELKALCIDQLDVFLQKETQIFAEKLFDAVNTKSYLPPPEQPSSGSLKVDFLQHQEKDIKKEELTKEEEREKKFSRRLNHSPPQSSSRYRDNRSRDERKKDDRSRKRDYDRNPPRRDSYRDRYNRRRGRSRSYSRSRSRSWSKERLRDSDREDLLPHFAQYGEIEDCQIDDASLHAIITFKTRAEAEAAAIHGARFKGQDLKLAWNKPIANMSAVDTEEAEPDEEEFQEESLVDDSLLQDDDEEKEKKKKKEKKEKMKQTIPDGDLLTPYQKEL